MSARATSGRFVISMKCEGVPDFVISWYLEDETFVLVFSDTSSFMEAMCSVVDLPLGCKATNDPETGRTRILRIPCKPHVPKEGEPDDSILKIPFGVTTQTDEEIGAIYIFMIGAPLARDGRTTVQSDDLHFIFDCIDERIIGVDIPDVRILHF